MSIVIEIGSLLGGDCFSVINIIEDNFKVHSSFQTTLPGPTKARYSGLIMSVLSIGLKYNSMSCAISLVVNIKH